MKPVLMGVGLAAFAALPGHAAPLVIETSAIEGSQAARRSMNLRIVEDKISDPAPLHRSGMIAQKSIAPNTILGVGLFKMTPKKLGSGDLRIDGSAPKSRRAAVSVIVKF